MAEYHISASMQNAIEKRKNRLAAWLCACGAAQLALAFLLALGGRDGVFLFCVLEPVLLYFVWRFLRHDIRSMTYKNQSGVVLLSDSDRYIERKIGPSRYSLSSSGVKVKYTIYISAEDHIITVPLPNKESFLSYQKDDEVCLIKYLPYPVITSRVPARAVCPSCAGVIRPDGICSECGVGDVYPKQRNTF